MNNAQTDAETLVRLDNDAYRGISKETLREFGVKLGPPDDAASVEDIPRIFAIGAPSIIGPDFTGSIPALLAKRHGGTRLWEVNTDTNLHIVITDLRTGEARIHSPFVKDKRRMATPLRSRTGPEPDEVQRASILHGVEQFGIPAMFGADWPSSAYSTSVMYYDWLSNAIRTERSGFQDPGPLPPVTASSLLKAVPPKGAEGLSGGSTITVEVSAKDAVRRKTVEGGEVIPASIVVIQLDEQYQQMIRLNLPIESGAAFAAGQIDLRAAWPGEPLVGECLLYLNVSGRITGPHKVTL